MIEVKNVIKKFDSFLALDDLSLQVEKGSVYGLVGPNGAGKTTLMKVISGIYRLDKGEVLVAGENSYENTKIKDGMILHCQVWYYGSIKKS